MLSCFTTLYLCSAIQTQLRRPLWGNARQENLVKIETSHIDARTTFSWGKHSVEGQFPLRLFALESRNVMLMSPQWNVSLKRPRGKAHLSPLTSAAETEKWRVKRGGRGGGCSLYFLTWNQTKCEQSQSYQLCECTCGTSGDANSACNVSSVSLPSLFSLNKEMNWTISTVADMVGLQSNL